MTEKPSKAFNYEHGQYICHVHAIIPEDDHFSLESFIDTIREAQKQGRLSASPPWIPMHAESPLDTDGIQLDERLHVTLLRGHRAVHYHQIRSMIEKIRTECETLKPIHLLLDRLRIFSNLERTRRFLCLASDKTQMAEPTGSPNPLFQLKQTIRSIVNQYAIKLTDEDETEDTLAHCSLMFKDQGTDCENESSLIEEVEQLLDSASEERPSCFLNLRVIRLKIGKKTYDIELGTKLV